MGYSEIRLQQAILQLQREAKEARAEERRTREGCLELVQALKEFVTCLEASDVTATPRLEELVDSAKTLLSPAVTGD